MFKIGEEHTHSTQFKADTSIHHKTDYNLDRFHSCKIMVQNNNVHVYIRFIHFIIYFDFVMFEVGNLSLLELFSIEQ